MELVASADLFDSAQVVEDSDSSKAIDRNVATKRYANSCHKRRTCRTVNCDGLMRPAHHASYSSFVFGHEEAANGQNIGGPVHILASAQFLPARRRVVIFAPRALVSKSRPLLSPFLLVKNGVGDAETRQLCLAGRANNRTVEEVELDTITCEWKAHSEHLHMLRTTMFHTSESPTVLAGGESETLTTKATIMSAAHSLGDTCNASRLPYMHGRLIALGVCPCPSMIAQIVWRTVVAEKPWLRKVFPPEPSFHGTFAAGHMRRAWH